MVVNTEAFFLSHRLPIATAALSEGYRVTIMAMEEEGRGGEVRSHGLGFIPLPSTRGGRNPFNELKLLLFLLRQYSRLGPDVVHHVTVKPILYGSIAARIAAVPRVINAVAGLGSIFIGAAGRLSPTYLIVIGLFRLSFGYDRIHALFQNEDDKRALSRHIALPEDRMHIIQGSGVDLEAFAYAPEPDDLPVTFVLAARIIGDKGIREYAEAARTLRHRHGDAVRFLLAGKLDDQNVTGIPRAEVEAWVDAGDLEWLGHQSDMARLYREANIVVLPSYREGLPKSLIEALAIGRPVVTTDVTGCRDVVDHGVNGLLVPARDSDALARAMETLIGDKALREAMGRRGRAKAVDLFSLENVVRRTLDLYED